MVGANQDQMERLAKNAVATLHADHRDAQTEEEIVELILGSLGPRPGRRLTKDRRAILAEEAVEKLLRHHADDPFIREYLQKTVIPVRTGKNRLKELLPSGLAGDGQEFAHKLSMVLPPQVMTDLEDPRLSLKDLLDYLDRLQEFGAQYAYLYRAPGSLSGDCLARLRSPGFVRKRLQEWGLERRYVDNPVRPGKRVWLAERPELAAVWRAGSRAVFRWVETRPWREHIPKSSPPRYINHEERSVNFVRLDVESGESEILLQWPPPNCEKPIEHLLSGYIQLTVAILGFDPFEAVPLDRIIVRALQERKVPVIAWTVLDSRGNRRELHGRPKVPSILDLPRNVEDGRELTYEESFERARNVGVRINLRALLGRAEIESACLEKEHEAIIGRLRDWSAALIRDPDLRDLATDGDQPKDLYEDIDSRLARGEKVIDGSDVAAETGHQEAMVRDVFEKVREKAPKRFEIVFSFTDPETAKTKEVTPEEAAAGAVSREEATPVLRVKPRGWLFALLRAIGIKVFRRMVRDLWNLGFTAIYLLLALWAYERILSLPPGEGPWILRAIFLVVTVILVALYGQMIGWDSLREALDLVLKLFDKSFWERALPEGGGRSG